MMARDIEDLERGTVKDFVWTMSTKDLAYRIAKALLLHYGTSFLSAQVLYLHPLVHGEFEYSARLREVYAKGGEHHITQRIANEMYIIRAAKSLDSSYSSSSSGKASDDEIINFRPANQKPSFKFEPSSIGASLPAFLATLKAANEELATGGPADSKFELSDSDSEGQHIEMNLGLGVLEQTAPADSTTTPFLTRKRKSGSISDSSDSTTSSPKKLKLVTTRKTADAAASSSAASSGSSSPVDATKGRRIKVILYHNSYTHAKIRSTKSSPKPTTIEKEASKKQGNEAKEEKAPKKPKIILKLTIKKGAKVRTIRPPNDICRSVYPPQSGTEPFPPFYHHTEAEMEAWNESVLATLGEGLLPGFDVVNDDD